ncbi:MAG: YfhO family protein [Planctomycetota bacterium]
MSGAASPPALRGRESALALLLCLLGAALLLAPALFGGRSTLSFELSDPRVDVRPWVRSAEGPLAEVNLVTPDIDFFVLPGMVRLRQLAEQGDPPWWDPAQFLGYPLQANLPSPSSSPAVWPTRWLDVVSALDWLLWFHTALAAWLAYRLCRMLGTGAAAAALGAAGFSLSAWMFTRWHLPHIHYTTAWWPGLIAAVEWLRRGKLARGLAEGGLCAGLIMLSGFPQVGLLLLAGALGYALCLREVRRPRALSLLLLSLGIGVALAAPQLAVSQAAYADSLRSGDAAREAAARQGLPPGALLALALPEIFGRPSDFSGAAPPAATMKDWLPQRRWFSTELQDNVVENALYVGAATLLLCWCLLFLRGQRGRWLLLLAGLALGISLVWPLLVSAAPWLSVLGAASMKRAIVLVAVCLPLAAALGLQALIERRLRPPWILGALLLSALALAPWLAARLDDPQAAEFSASLTNQAWRQGLFLGATLLALGLMTRAAPTARWSACWSWAPAVLLFADLASLALAFNPMPRQHEPFPPTPALAELAARPGRFAHFGGASVGNNLLPPSAAATVGLQSIQGTAPMVPTRVAELLGLIEGPLYDAVDPRVGRPFQRVESLRHPLLDLLGVSTVVHADPGLAAATGWPVLFERPEEGLGALARPGAGPRAFLCGGAVVVREPAERLARLARSDFPVHRTVLLERTHGLSALPEQGALQALEVLGDAATRRPLRFEAAFPGIAVLTEAYAPGWSARLDGEEVELLVVDHALMGVAVNPGPHELVFSYTPPGLAAGSIVAGLALVVLLAAARSAWAAGRASPHEFSH